MYYRGAAAAIVVYDITRAVRVPHPTPRPSGLQPTPPMLEPCCVLPSCFLLCCLACSIFSHKCCAVVNVVLRLPLLNFMSCSDPVLSLFPQRSCVRCHTVSMQDSFKTPQVWINELRKSGPEGIIIAIAGNKKDLDHQRVRGKPADATVSIPPLLLPGLYGCRIRHIWHGIPIRLHIHESDWPDPIHLSCDAYASTYYMEMGHGNCYTRVFHHYPRLSVHPLSPLQHLYVRSWSN